MWWKKKNKKNNDGLKEIKELFEKGDISKNQVIDKLENILNDKLNSSDNIEALVYKKEIVRIKAVKNKVLEINDSLYLADLENSQLTKQISNTF